MINITLVDGSVKEVEKGLTALEIVEGISKGLARATYAVIIDGELRDLRDVVDKDCKFAALTFDDEGGRWAFRHTSAHLMAQAVKRLYPTAKLAIGPAIADGFYYDIDFEEDIVTEDLSKIEKEMKKIVKENPDIERFELSREDALKWAEEQNDEYKTELISELPEDEVITFYKQGDFTDLCAGPHIMSIKTIKAFKLTAISGAYWRGDEKNKMLTRIYGTSFPKASLLDEHLEKLEEAKKRDHRKLGAELKLFTLLEEAPGMPFFFPKGLLIKNLLVDYWRGIHKKAGYVEISTPLMLDKDLWIRSGHYGHYKDNMYVTNIDEKEFAIKPMNCPGGMLVYNQDIHSYRDFPLRVSEMGIVHRHEKSGALHGLMRVRTFTQDDAHIFMTKEQIKDEIKNVVLLTDEIYKTFNFSYSIELSTQPENSMGSDEDWRIAENALQEALEELDLPYELNEGDGAFYGPKIDFHLHDSLNRSWQCGTIQLDFQMPERFELDYIGSDGEKHRPIMIHRAIYGSLERFLGILIEHYAGRFPAWLAPVQAIVLPISDKYADYATKVEQRFIDEGLRVETDHRAEKIGYKIREARNQRVPYIIIVGEKEEAEGTIALRSREGDEGATDIDEFVKRIKGEIEERK